MLVVMVHVIVVVAVVAVAAAAYKTLARCMRCSVGKRAVSQTVCLPIIQALLPAICILCTYILAMCAVLQCV